MSYFTLSERDTLASLATVRHVGSAVDIYVEGKPADSFAVIASGAMVKRGTGERRPLGPPTVVGTLPLLRKNERLRRRTASLLTLSDVVLVDIPYHALDRLAPERKDSFVDSIAEEALSIIERLDRVAGEHA